MALPNPSKLKTLIQSEDNISSASLATRILLGRLRIEVRNNPTLIDAKVTELMEFVRVNRYAADDLAHI
ncbi:MAG: hypothetical protein QUV10_09040 [Paracoccaceae bacterium]|jgi:hypothetical protein|uniref:hypothetical protein n=1 Tax=unclassified Seohaeicola TaxID=2641111 RepID=UPI00237C0C75|nr:MULTISPECIES: hypothetical protein [unclassified Seohaeicola]MDD9705890.1 hypothetical protein [Seohaeicola sp. 4SK31]MDD9736178.1 hypothetical protein [Seohaeicola sp. SP36]MDF1709509.1 hypothetical protein [Paracoccaceae bacterium]MDM7969751.1 hypothetical protein [Paracoccaceae bacterium]